MSQNLRRELGKLRQKLVASLCETIPTRDFSAAIIMAMVGLHVMEARIRKTRNLEERRRLIDEFNKGKRTIEKGIRTLKQGAGRQDRMRDERKGSMS